MQINKELIGIPDAIVKIAHQADFRLSLEEVYDIHQEYRSCCTVRVCPCCGYETHPDNLVVVVDRPGDRENPREAHNVCNHCFQDVSPEDLVKPDFETWLKLTA